MANPVGRPTLYSAETITKTREYIDSCVDEVVAYDKFTKLKVKIPTIEGLAVHLKIARKTIYEWIDHEDKQEFSNIIEELLSIQADRLLNSGLSGDYNSTIAKVLLTKHGHREGVDQTSGGKPIQTITGMVIQDSPVHNYQVPIEKPKQSE